MRIAIVNDMQMAIEALRRVLITVPDYEIAWIARDGLEAVVKCTADTPDVILMDLFMPRMGGVEATRRIMNESPCAIVMVTTTVNGNSSGVFEAMGYGALDAVNTPILGSRENYSEDGAQLLAKVATIRKLLGKSLKSTSQKSAAILPPKPAFRSRSVPPLVVIGASTGGPKAVATILSQLPANFNAAIVVVQHVDVQFAPSLISWLNQQTPLTVELAQTGCPLTVGKVAIAGSNDHLILNSNLTFNYTPDPINTPYRPSVNTFFSSVAANYPGQGVGILLTGMGKDGGDGMSLLRAAGWHTIAQNKATCVVYGMPKAAVDLGAAVEVLPLEAIAPACIRAIDFPRSHLDWSRH
jgi:two-component system response regulator WspF